MRSAAVLKDVDRQEDHSRDLTASDDKSDDNSIDHEHDVDDSFTCRTDEMTVRVSNVRRVTTRPGEIAEDVSQLIRRLLEGIRPNDRCHIVNMFTTLLQRRRPRVIPAVLFRSLEPVLLFFGGVAHSEDLFEELEYFSGSRRNEFINALTPVVDQMEQEDIVDTAPDVEIPSVTPGDFSTQSFFASGRFSR